MTTWYRTGTIAVTNGGTGVTGTGTAWASSVFAGDGLRGPDGTWYEVASVGSNTALTLVDAYAGATASGQAYAIMPTRRAEADLLTSLQTLIADQQAVVDGVGAGKFAAGTLATPGVRSGTDEDTGIYWPAANQMAVVAGGVQRLLLSQTAAQLDVSLTGTSVQASATDTTVGRVARLQGGAGFFGIGLNNDTLQLAPNNDLDALRISGLWRYQSDTTGKPSSIAGVVLHICRLPTSHIQIELGFVGSVSKRYYGNSTWSEWVAV